MTTSTDYWGAMYMNIGNNNSGENMRLLFEAILTLETVEECNAFFHDICTIQEMKAMKERFEVARMLDDGLTYVETVSYTHLNPYVRIVRLGKIDGYIICLYCRDQTSLSARRTISYRPKSA